MGAWAGRNDIEPLIFYLDVVADFVPSLGRELRDVIGVLRLLHARSQKRKRGKPAGALARWRDANYLAAAVSEGRIAGLEARACARQHPEFCQG